jgi:hypothetical protein
METVEEIDTGAPAMREPMKRGSTKTSAVGSSKKLLVLLDVQTITSVLRCLKNKPWTAADWR